MDLRVINFPELSNGQSLIMMKSWSMPREKQCRWSIELASRICYYKRHFSSLMWNLVSFKPVLQHVHLMGPTPCELEEEAVVFSGWFTPRPLPATDREITALNELIAQVKCSPTQFRPAGSSATFVSKSLAEGGWTSKARCSLLLLFRLGIAPSTTSEHPFTGWQIEERKCVSGHHKVYSQRVGRVVTVDLGMWISSVVRQSGRQRAGPQPSATVGHTKHLVTDPSGCMTTLHWAACVWESWIDTWSVFTADLVHTSGIPPRSCPH